MASLENPRHRGRRALESGPAAGVGETPASSAGGSTLPGTPRPGRSAPTG